MAPEDDAISHPAFSRLDHRPWPLPARPWVSRQTWRDLLFAHWPVPAEVVRPLIPAGLEVDVHGGTSWVGVVPFLITGAAPRALPDLPVLSAFPELNVRLYVRRDDRPGVWFLSLDADSALAVWGARRFYHLPYFRARMSIREQDGAFHYSSERRSLTPARFTGRYRPTGPVSPSAPGTLEHFLTERYCLYAQAPHGRLERTEVHHLPWPLQPASGELSCAELLAPHGLEVSGPPLLHFARCLEVAVWWPAPV
jgi:uncharacterized protein YqjF (DUF2071 family)